MYAPELTFRDTVLAQSFRGGRPAPARADDADIAGMAIQKCGQALDIHGGAARGQYQVGPLGNFQAIGQVCHRCRDIFVSFGNCLRRAELRAVVADDHPVAQPVRQVGDGLADVPAADHDQAGIG